MSDPKKKFMQGIGLENKIPASAWRKKKYSCEYVRKYVEHMCTLLIID